MKIFFRFVLLNLLVGFIIAYTHPFSIQKKWGELTFGEFSIFLWVLVSILSGMCWWGYMFYHWGVSEFTNRLAKKIWFFVLLFGTMAMFLGPLVYYVFVYEMQKGLVGNKEITA